MNREGAVAVEVKLKVLVQKEQWWQLNKTMTDRTMRFDHPSIVLLLTLSESQIRLYLVKLLVEDQQLCKCI